MIIEYFNESTDILASKVVSEEITLEEAVDAYNDLADKAIDEWTDELLEAVDCGAITEAEANLVLEMSGLFENGLVLEANYDLSKLSPVERKKIQDRLDAMPEAQRKKAERELAKQFPSQEYKDKVAKRKKILAGVGAAAAIGAGAALGAKAYVDKDAENRSINENNPAYAKFFKKREEAIKKLNESPAYKDLINARSDDKALAAGAKFRLDKLPPSERAQLRDQYKADLADIESDFSSGIGAAIGKERQKEGYKKQLREQRKKDIKLNKATSAQIKKNKEYAAMDAEWYAKNTPLGLLRKAKSTGASVANAPTKASNTINKFFGNTDKVKDLKHKETGVFRSGVEKNAAQTKQELNKKTLEAKAKKEKNIYKKSKEEE